VRDALDTVQDWPPEPARVMTVRACRLRTAKAPRLPWLHGAGPGAAVSFRARADAAFLLRVAAARRALSADLLVCDTGSRVLAVIDVRPMRKARAVGAGTSGWRGCCRPPACACMSGAKATCRRAAEVRTALAHDLLRGTGPMARGDPVATDAADPVAETHELDALLAAGDAAAVGEAELEPVPSASTTNWKNPHGARALTARAQLEQRLRELARVEGLQVLELLAHADEVDRHGRCAFAHQRAIAASTPPLAVPSSLVTTRPVSPARVEGLDLGQRVLPVLPSTTSSTSCGAPVLRLADHAADLLQLLHQVQLRRQAAGGVGDDHVAAARRPALTASKVTAAGSPPSWLTISTGCGRPTRQLLARGGAEGVGRGQQHLLVGAGQVPRELADGGGLAGAVDADDHDHRRRVLRRPQAALQRRSRLGDARRPAAPSPQPDRWPWPP
jgi:hypothetical protein